MKRGRGRGRLPEDHPTGLQPQRRLAHRRHAQRSTARAMAFGLDSPLHFDFPVAWQDRTSTAFRDNWAFGYTPEFVVAVWMGNFDGVPMHGVSGVTGAAPVMHAILTHLHERFGTSWYATPPASSNGPCTA